MAEIQGEYPIEVFGPSVPKTLPSTDERNSRPIESPGEITPRMVAGQMGTYISNLTSLLLCSGGTKKEDQEIIQSCGYSRDGLMYYDTMVSTTYDENNTSVPSIYPEMVSMANKIALKLAQNVRSKAPPGMKFFTAAFEPDWIQQQRIQSAVKDPELVKFVQQISSTYHTDWKTLGDLASQIVTRPDFSIDRNILGKVEHFTPQLQMTFMDSIPGHITVRDIATILEKVNPYDLRKSPALRLLRYLQDVSTYRYYNINNIARKVFKFSPSPDISEEYYRTVAALGVRPDAVGLAPTDPADADTQQAINAFVALVSQTGSERLHHKRLLDPALGDENPHTVIRIVLDLVRQKKIRSMTVEAKMMFTHDKDLSKCPDQEIGHIITKKFEKDIAATRWGMFQLVFSVYLQAAARGIIDPDRDDFYTFVRRFLDADQQKGLGIDKYKGFLRFTAPFTSGDHQAILQVGQWQVFHKVKVSNKERLVPNVIATWEHQKKTGKFTLNVKIPHYHVFNPVILDPRRQAKLSRSHGSTLLATITWLTSEAGQSGGDNQDPGFSESDINQDPGLEAVIGTQVVDRNTPVLTGFYDARKPQPKEPKYEDIAWGSDE